MSLYNKYECKNLNDLLANENNKIILNGFLKQENIPQGYLFHGVHGVGKTLTANLFSKELNCKDNIYLTNASNDRGIDAIRQIIESANYKSLDGNSKAFIIDESHQLPVLSQEALLTTLQNPPKKTYFFFCTTELGKMINTIKSRCKCLEFEKISTRVIYPYLIDISIKEKNEISKTVARKIAETSKGHVRDALNILESVLQFKDENKQLEIAGKKIEEDDKQIIDLCRELLNNNSSWESIRNILKQLQKENPESIRKVIIAYMNTVLLNGNNMRAGVIIESLQNQIFEQGVLTMQLFSIFNK